MRPGSKKATHPCRCGYLDDSSLACSRAPKCAQDYQSRISGPLFDRIDLHVDVPPVRPADLALPVPAEGSSQVAGRVSSARERQAHRFGSAQIGERPQTNAEVCSKLLEEVATPDEDGQRLLATALERLKLSARGYYRILRVARTLADLDGSDGVRRIHVAEALSFRRITPNRS